MVSNNFRLNLIWYHLPSSSVVDSSYSGSSSYMASSSHDSELCVFFGHRCSWTEVRMCCCLFLMPCCFRVRGSPPSNIYFQLCHVHTDLSPDSKNPWMILCIVDNVIFKVLRNITLKLFHNFKTVLFSNCLFYIQPMAVNLFSCEILSTTSFSSILLPMSQWFWQLLPVIVSPLWILFQVFSLTSIPLLTL